MSLHLTARCSSKRFDFTTSSPENYGASFVVLVLCSCILSCLDRLYELVSLGRLCGNIAIKMDGQFGQIWRTLDLSSSPAVHQMNSEFVVEVSSDLWCCLLGRECRLVNRVSISVSVLSCALSEWLTTTEMRLSRQQNTFFMSPNLPTMTFIEQNSLKKSLRL